MPSNLGIFLGGLGGGLESGFTNVNQAQNLSARTGFLGRETAVHEQALQQTIQQNQLAQNEKLIGETMTGVTEFIKAGLAANRPPAELYAKIEPVIDTLQPNLRYTGRSIDQLKTAVKAQVGLPAGMEAAVQGGRNVGAGEAQKQATAQDVLTLPQGTPGVGLTPGAIPGTGVPTVPPAQQPLVPAVAAPHAAPGTPGSVVPGGPTTSVARGFIINPKDRVEAANKLRDDFTKDSTNFKQVHDQYVNLKGLPTDVKTWGPGEDLTMTFSILKMLDPSSVASPGEQAAVRGSGSLSDQFAVIYNKVAKEGAVLGPDVRQNLYNRALRIHQDRANQWYETVHDPYADRAKEIGLTNPKSVIVDIAKMRSPTTSIGTSGKTSSGLNWSLQ